MSLYTSSDVEAREILPLTSLRAIAAWWVVMFHFVRGSIHRPILHHVLASGHVAVDLFFVLSGFVLAHRYRAVDLATWADRRAFWRRRFARVYPLYLVSLALGFYAEWPRSLHDLIAWKGAVRLLAQLVLLNAFSHQWMLRLNWAAWSLSVEAFFYFLFPWVLLWASRKNPRALIVWCSLAALTVPALYTAIDPDHLGRPLALGDEALWSWYLKFFPLQRLPMFVAGIAAARLAEQVTPKGHAAAAALCGLLGVVATNLIPYPFLQGGALLPMFVVLIVALGCRSHDAHPVKRWLGSAPLVGLGHSSYATYILHVPLFLVWAHLDPDAWTNPSHITAYLAVLLVASLCAYRFLEEPARQAIVVV